MESYFLSLKYHLWYFKVNLWFKDDKKFWIYLKRLKIGRRIRCKDDFRKNRWRNFFLNKSDCMKVYFFMRMVRKHALIQWLVKIELHSITLIKINQNFVIYFFRKSSLQRISLPILSLLRQIPKFFGFFLSKFDLKM